MCWRHCGPPHCPLPSFHWVWRGGVEGHSDTSTFSPHSPVEVGHNRTHAPWWLPVQDDLEGGSPPPAIQETRLFSFLILRAGKQQIRIKYTRLAQLYSKSQFQVCTVLRAVSCSFHTLCFNTECLKLYLHYHMVMIHNQSHNTPNTMSFSRTVISSNGEYIMLTQAEKHLENFFLQQGREQGFW